MQVHRNGPAVAAGESADGAARMLRWRRFVPADAASASFNPDIVR